MALMRGWDGAKWAPPPGQACAGAQALRVNINGGWWLKVSCSRRTFLGAAYFRAGQLGQCPHQDASQGAATTSSLSTHY